MINMKIKEKLMGNIPGYEKVWFDPNALAKIMPIDRVEKK